MRSSPRSIWRQGNKHGLSLRDIYMEQRLERAPVIRRAWSAQHNHGCCRFLIMSNLVQTWGGNDADKSYRIGSDAVHDGLAVGSSSSRHGRHWYWGSVI